jgi:hypothetical protein
MSTKLRYRTNRLGTLLGLCIAAGGLGMTAPARADVTLRDPRTGFCLGVGADITAPGAGLIMWACDGTPSQEWFLDADQQTSTGSLVIAPSSGDLGLGIATPPVGQPVNQANLMVSEIVPALGGVNPQRVIGVQAGVMAPGTLVVTWTVDRTFPLGTNNPTAPNNQGWQWIYEGTDQNGHNCWEIANAGISSGNAPLLSILGGSTQEGAQVVIEYAPRNSAPGRTDYTYGPGQLWCVY